MFLLLRSVGSSSALCRVSSDIAEDVVRLPIDSFKSADVGAGGVSGNAEFPFATYCFLLTILIPSLA